MRTRSELVLAVCVRPDPALLAALRWLMDGEGPAPPGLPASLAQHPRAAGLLSGGGLAGPGFPPLLEPRFAESEEDAWVLQVWTALKDYGTPLLSFLDWLGPFVEASLEGPRDVGWYRVEGDARATLVEHDPANGALRLRGA